MNLKGNKGEWSEIYTLLKLLADRQIYVGDSNLNKIENLIFPIVKILRDETNGTYEFSYNHDIVVIKGKELEFRVPLQEFKNQASILFSKLKESTSATFSIPEIEVFLNSFNCKSIKAKSTVKSDIKIVIHDQRTGTTPELGFSIKSQLGGASSLLNAGRTTNFIYSVSDINLNEQQIAEINAIETKSKIKDRLIKISSYGGSLKFETTESQNFGNNLMLIDSALPQIVSEIVLIFFTSGSSRISDLVKKLNEINPLKFNSDSDHPYYAYKIKKLLTDIALGMMPSKVWKGELDATGGYLIVKEDGSILCYHIYNRNEFEDYLLTNTKLETASSKRHDFGSIYKEDSNLFIKLNLQIK